ncbi:hypothetical protein QZH41_001044 [Actinostola sp. cb2023]|nr:hypothetical protein QZH41_001044 [Actinostola sp. cb2023]
MALNDRIQEVTQDVASMKEIFLHRKSSSDKTEATQEAQQEEEAGERTTQEAQPGFHLKCDVSMFKLQMETSASTRFGVELSKTSVTLEGRDVNVAMGTAVVLFDNNNTFTFQLLLDEAKHWSDRMETLQNRLNTIRMTPGNLLTVQKEIMLHKKLLEKNAELYIQRSKALYSDTPMRKSLLLWEFEGLDLKVLADESYHGKRKAVEMMASLNSESPFPESDIDFSTLWCRTVKGTLESHCCKLRDYPQPIFTSKQVNLSGTFLAAEQAARNIAQYDSSIVVEKPWDDMVVQRSLTVLKYYYDLDFDVDTLELAWGVDTEPGLAMVSLAFGKKAVWLLCMLMMMVMMMMMMMMMMVMMMVVMVMVMLVMVMVMMMMIFNDELLRTRDVVMMVMMMVMMVMVMMMMMMVMVMLGKVMVMMMIH